MPQPARSLQAGVTAVGHGEAARRLILPCHPCPLRCKQAIAPPRRRAGVEDVARAFAAGRYPVSAGRTFAGLNVTPTRPLAPVGAPLSAETVPQRRIHRRPEIPGSLRRTDELEGSITTLRRCGTYDVEVVYSNASSSQVPLSTASEQRTLPTWPIAV
jgi:hypothetical protein